MTQTYMERIEGEHRWFCVPSYEDDGLMVYNQFAEDHAGATEFCDVGDLCLPICRTDRGESICQPGQVAVDREDLDKLDAAAKDFTSLDSLGFIVDSFLEKYHSPAKPGAGEGGSDEH